ncbi:hypothetical protein AHAS_Ahas17G0203500 [Arachis hypogaea]
MLMRGFISIGWGLLVVTERSTVTIVLVCIIEWLLVIAHWRGLSPRGLIKSLWLLPSLIIPTLMHVLIIAPIPYYNIGTKLKATWVRIHSS